MEVLLLRWPEIK